MDGPLRSSLDYSDRELGEETLQDKAVDVVVVNHEGEGKGEFVVPQPLQVFLFNSRTIYLTVLLTEVTPSGLESGIFKNIVILGKIYIINSTLKK